MHIHDALTRGVSPADLHMDWYDCARHGFRLPGTGFVSRCANGMIEMKIVKMIRVDVLRDAIVKLICKRKTGRVIV